jgi:hypothetical protein
MLSLAAVTAIDRTWHLSEHVNAHRAAAHYCGGGGDCSKAKVRCRVARPVRWHFRYVWWSSGAHKEIRKRAPRIASGLPAPALLPVMNH